LLLTNDLDILEAAIFVLLRPAQQYADKILLEPGQKDNITRRLHTFIRGWDELRGMDISSMDQKPTVSPVHVTYYTSMGPQSIDLQPSASDVYEKLREANMPLDDQLRCFNRIRVALSDSRAQLVRIRLLALATYSESPK
jgi:hypothetical protein